MIRPRTGAKTRWRDAAVGLVLTGIGITLLLFWSPVGASFASSILLQISLASLIVACAVCLRSGFWSSAAAFTVVFWLFHFGLVAAIGSGALEITEITDWDQRWLLGQHGVAAALLALIGTIGLAAGVFLALSVRGDERPRRDSEITVAYATGGAICVITAVVAWVLVVIVSGGPSLLFGSYGDYLALTGAYPGTVSLVWLALGFGSVLVAAGPKSSLQRTAVGTLVLFGAVALPLGLRGELMFPAVAAFVARAAAGRPLSAVRAGVIVAATLIAIPLIRDVRAVGLAGRDELSVRFQAAGAFAELGGTLHPVQKVIQWREEGDPLEWGQTYWAPIERATARVFGLQRVAADDDFRIMNVLVADRIGAIGFSPIAESYRNFGSPGVFTLMLGLGVVLGFIDTIPSRRNRILVIAIVLVPLLINIRNSFVSVPAQCLAGLVIAGAIHAISHTAPHRVRTRIASPVRL